MEQIYLDYNASTPIASEVKDAMRPFLEEYYGNPSALHFAGTHNKQAIENARMQVSRLINATPNEITFTSGGSEANNHVLKGIFESYANKGTHIITTRIEHPAILNPCHYLEKHGAKVTYLEVDQYGRVDLHAVEEAITNETILISIMHANNEVGTIQPIHEIGQIARKHGVLFHTDASQSVGKVPLDVNSLQVDFLTIAGHKMYAPKGVGALYIREGIKIEPLIHGAGHESGRRAGTENVLLIVGLGKACELAEHNQAEVVQVRNLRDYFLNQLQSLPNAKVSLNGHPDFRLPNTLNVNFEGRVGQEILDRLPQIAASTGSACHAGTVNLSPVLNAMGVEESIGMGAVRFSLGKYTTKEEIDQVIELLNTI